MRNEIEAGPPILHLTRGFNDAILLTDELLARIDVPVRFLWGADDLFGGESIARAFTARIPTSELEMVPGGHAVWMDDADGIARATDAFLTCQS
jgi:pimeloyl-ACP methyl ester carboxylesterase